MFIDNTNLSDYNICEDLLHLSYSGTCKLANNFIGVINGNLEKSSFSQRSVTNPKYESVSASGKSWERKQPINASNILFNLKVRVNNKLIIDNLNINSIVVNLIN